MVNAVNEYHLAISSYDTICECLTIDIIFFQHNPFHVFAIISAPDTRSMVPALLIWLLMALFFYWRALSGIKEGIIRKI